MEITFDSLPSLVRDLKEGQDRIEKLLLQHSEPQQKDRWMDIDEYIEYDPRHPAKATVYGNVHQGRIPFYKKGKKLFFLKSEIDAWLTKGRRKTAEELAEEVAAERG